MRYHCSTFNNKWYCAPEGVRKNEEQSTIFCKFYLWN